MPTYDVYNLVFPDYCNEMTIFGYRFIRVDNYESKVKNLYHLAPMDGEFKIPVKIGVHSITAKVEIEDKEEASVIDWVNTNTTALDDILLLISLFTRRKVFKHDEQLAEKNIPIVDPRIFPGGKVLLTSLRNNFHKGVYPNECDKYFENGLNQVYENIRNPEWIKLYGNGHFLFMLEDAISQLHIEPMFTLCWIIWEHLYWHIYRQISIEQKVKRSSKREEILFILNKYTLFRRFSKEDNEIASRLFSEVRNKLMHYGKFSNTCSNYKECFEDSPLGDANVFTHLTEMLAIKILNMNPLDKFGCEQIMSDRIKKSKSQSK